MGGLAKGMSPMNALKDEVVFEGFENHEIRTFKSELGRDLRLFKLLSGAASGRLEILTPMTQRHKKKPEGQKKKPGGQKRKNPTSFVFKGKRTISGCF
ncbi:MAG: hypothetical protein LBJ64_00960 [Deltaproteobacteria bacterium]|jgi:hypothetical protein|nr:hypothetical protein [Deltaproteobacteria bacterium]